MGLTVYYRYSIKADADRARALVERIRKVAEELPFDQLSEIVEFDPPDGEFAFQPATEQQREWKPGSIYLDRKRRDGKSEVVHIPSLHVIRFIARVEGAESAMFGLASHPPVVVHREDVIRKTKHGEDHQIGAGSAVEFPTRLRGRYSWQQFCKTQYAAHPDCGGIPNFLRAHLILFDMIDALKRMGMRTHIRDDAKYWRHRNQERLVAELKRWDELIAGFAGPLSDALSKHGAVVAPIKQRPDFEHLEAKGADRFKKMRARSERESAKVRSPKRRNKRA